MNTGPVIKYDRAEASPPLSLSRRRTLAPDAARPVGWAKGDRERCPSTCDDERRCMLREGHSGFHAWRSPPCHQTEPAGSRERAGELGGLRIFEWG